VQNGQEVSAYGFGNVGFSSLLGAPTKEAVKVEGESLFSGFEED
jgi:hypothetical protein